MGRLRLGVCVLITALLAGNWLLGDDEKDAPKVKTLPKNYSKLGLSDKQKDTIYTIQGRYHAKIEVWDKQIKEAKASQKKEVEGVLTDAQKARLRELLLGETDDKDKKDKKDKEE
jgi:hypothetical protein